MRSIQSTVDSPQQNCKSSVLPSTVDCGLKAGSLKKAIGMVESVILIAVVSAALLAIRAYVEKGIKTSTKNYTDVILGVEKEEDTSAQEAASKEYYEMNPVAFTGTRSAEGIVYSENITREYAATTQTTPQIMKTNNTSRFYLDVVPARRGMIQTVRIGEIAQDAYEAMIFDPSGRK